VGINKQPPFFWPTICLGCIHGRNRVSRIQDTQSGCNWQHCMWHVACGKGMGKGSSGGMATAGSAEILKVYTYGFLLPASYHMPHPHLVTARRRTHPQPNRKMSHKYGPKRFMCTSSVMTMPAMQIHAWPAECALDNNSEPGVLPPMPCIYNVRMWQGQRERTNSICHRINKNVAEIAVMRRSIK